jgi:protein CpxP
MTNVIRKVAVPALVTLALFTTSAWAQTAAPAAVATKPAAAAHQGHDRQAFVEQRLNDMHAKLKITPQQSSQWDAFAQTMRDSAQQTQQAYRDRAQKLSTQSAEDAMNSYAELTQMHADNTKKLAASFGTLYAAMSDEQKKSADVLFREQRNNRHSSARKHKRAAPEGAAAPAPASN